MSRLSPGNRNLPPGQHHCKVHAASVGFCKTRGPTPVGSPSTVAMRDALASARLQHFTALNRRDRLATVTAQQAQVRLGVLFIEEQDHLTVVHLLQRRY